MNDKLAVLRIPEVPDEGNDTLANPANAAATDISQYSVLNHQTMMQVWKDISRTVLPSWMCPPPHNFGSASHGTLKADEWRTACTVSLPITLIRLWGPHSDASERKKEILKNFLDLIHAVKLVTGRSVSAIQIEGYKNFMTSYLQGVVRLFPDSDIVPNQHLSLHTPNALEYFGPIRSWWSFPFERFIGVLQNIKTNMRLGMLLKLLLH